MTKAGQKFRSRIARVLIFLFAHPTGHDNGDDGNEDDKKAKEMDTATMYRYSSPPLETDGECLFSVS